MNRDENILNLRYSARLAESLGALALATSAAKASNPTFASLQSYAVNEPMLRHRVTLGGIPIYIDPEVPDGEVWFGYYEKDKFECCKVVRIPMILTAAPVAPSSEEQSPPKEEETEITLPLEKLREICEDAENDLPGEQ